jgi:hypothetical protein
VAPGDTFLIQLIISATRIRIVPIHHWGEIRVRNDGINSAAGVLFLGFYHDILIIHSIRQFQNPFIPLSFHWSGQHINSQIVQKRIIHDCYTHLSLPEPVLDSGGEIASHPFHNQDPNLALYVLNYNQRISMRLSSGKYRVVHGGDNSQH